MGDIKINLDNDVLTSEDVKGIIKNVLKTDNFIINSTVIAPASEDTLGFLGEHYIALISVKTSDEIKNFNFFVKKIPKKVPQHYEYASKTRAFYKEIELYKTLFIDLEFAQNNIKNSTKWHPDYFYSKGEDVLVLENLMNFGYYMYPERSYMDEEHFHASIKALAAMHAASIVFEEKFNEGKVKSLSPNLNKLSNKKSKISVGELYSHLNFETEASDEKGHPGNTFHEAGIKSQLKIVDLLPGYSQEEKKKISNKLPDVMRKFLQLVKPSERFKNVYVHGDLWSNNILFKKDKSGKVNDALIIDFQLARYAPPAHDLLMFMHFVLEKSYMDKNEEKIYKFYYKSFIEELDKNSIDGHAIISWENFLESCIYYKDLGLIGNLFYFQLILSPPEITNTFLATPEAFTKNMIIDRSEMVVDSFLKDELCRIRVTQSMNEAIKKFNLVQ